MSRFSVLMLMICLFIHTVSVARAVTVEFIGPCDRQPVLTDHTPRPSAKNVGELTIAILNHHRIPYRGSESGIAEAFDAPSGLDSAVVISDEEMLSYGWCYSVDGVAPEVYPDQVPLTASVEKVQWFYAYSHYRRGEWIKQCVPGWKRPHPQAYCQAIR